MKWGEWQCKASCLVKEFPHGKIPASALFLLQLIGKFENTRHLH